MRYAMPLQAKEQPDEQLVELLTGSEVETALSVLYERYSRTVYGAGLKLLGDRSLAEEVVQEVFFRVWRSSHTFEPSKGSFSTWLYRVTRNVALDLYRKRSCRIRPVSAGETEIAARRDSSADPQETVDDSWLFWRLSRVLGGLDPAHREVIDLAYFQGCSQREISEQTGLPLGTIKSRTSSALRRLREELVGQHDLRRAGR